MISLLNLEKLLGYYRCLNKRLEIVHNFTKTVVICVWFLRYQSFNISCAGNL